VAELSVRELLAPARRRLAAAPFSPSPREALLLLGAVLGWSEAQVLARDDEPVPAATTAAFGALLERRLRGEPVAYLLGRREFWGRTFRVDPRVLVPRPETEHLVEAALALTLPPRPLVLDLGTGSGCIAATLALELPGSRVVAVDRSPAALAVAAANGRTLGSRVGWIGGDWARSLAASSIDLVVSNPPYLDRNDAVSAEVADWEPPAALWGGDSGLAVIDDLLASLSLAGLRREVPVLLEIGAGQLAPLGSRIAPAGWVLASSRNDLAGIPRVVELRRG
jgi:release factor glutamine methyltransferase